MAESPTSGAALAFVGVVLCGGSSRRMGRDKALLPVDGQPMARRVADVIAAAGAAEVVAVGGDERQLAAIGLTVVPDDHPGDGPLPATMTALAWAIRSHPDIDAVFVASCDLVAPDPMAVAATVGALLDHPGAVGAVPVSGGHRQWTHAAWQPRAVTALEAAYERGDRSLKRAGADLLVFEVEGLPEAALADADTPEDLPKT